MGTLSVSLCTPLTVVRGRGLCGCSDFVTGAQFCRRGRLFL